MKPKFKFSRARVWRTKHPFELKTSLLRDFKQIRRIYRAAQCVIVKQKPSICSEGLLFWSDLESSVRLSKAMEAKVVRQNTLKLKFGAQSRNPINDEVFAFFQKQGWDCDMLSAMYREDFCLFIKFQREDQLKHAFQVTVSAANGMFKYVRVFGLPPEVDDKALAFVFAKYGSIQQLVRVGDGQGPGLLKLQARRSRSLTLRQTATKGNGKEGITVDVNQFPPLGK